MSPQRLGQHFLHSAAWRERIIRLVLGIESSFESAVGGPHTPTTGDELWLEIGAGHGEMTRLLAPRAGQLMAIELDPKLLPELRERMAALPNVTVLAGDVLAMDIGKITAERRFRAYGNLPYYITSPIVHRLLEQADRLDAAFLVVQLEVAERMAARPGSREYGYFSAFTQFYSRPEILLRIPPGAFQPPPKVSSALIRLSLPGERNALGIRDEKGFLTFLKVCFAQKRKTLRNNLRALVPQERASDASELLRECAIKPSARAEELTLVEFARLFAAMQKLAFRLRPAE